jgi:hypothetical protein
MKNAVLLVFLRSVLQLLVTANVVPCSMYHSTFMIEPINSFETSVIQES